MYEQKCGHPATHKITSVCSHLAFMTSHCVLLQKQSHPQRSHLLTFIRAFSCMSRSSSVHKREFTVMIAALTFSRYNVELVNHVTTPFSSEYLFNPQLQARKTASSNPKDKSSCLLKLKAGKGQNQVESQIHADLSKCW